MTMWRKELIELTRKQAYPGTMMKSSAGKFGTLKTCGPDGIEIVDAELKNNMPYPTYKVIAP